MKTINDLTKPEKVNFLRKVQAGEVNPRQFKGQPVFLTKKGDSFLATMQGLYSEGIPLTSDAIIDQQGMAEILKNSL